ncbi:LuxR C-terminal-related transcriptional regulator [Desulfotomaculum sp. 1211_IL3151]|uniref:LuxR C-terminal-related transcriptional regulator n=1 Tax=Desulfotomaculum sp. 1211_IL3151 TaxID=3084055 RepID=UPI002FD9B776
MVIPLNNYAYKIPLLQTKLQIPHTLSGLVDRPRICARLDGMLQSRLTLVTASAGFGKTTAIAQWARQAGFPVAWLSLDSGDNDPVRFWTYVAATLRGIRPDIGVEIESMLCSSTSPPWEAAISLLIDGMSHLPCDFVLVLDDYHAISESLVHETLSFMVRYAPGQFHLIISGRTEPSLPLPRLRAAGLVTELTARNLGFTTEEVAAFYKQRNIDLTREEVEKLADRTGGWAAGMQMAALSLLESDDKAVTIEGFGGRDRLLACYFREEVFGGVVPDVQDFLLQTSILSHLSGPLCEAVTGRPDSGAVLSAVGRICGFVASLDDQWYVYHQLFAEFLQGLLKERYPDRVRSLYCKAARWCKDCGLTAKAIDYFLQGGEHGQAARQVACLVPEMFDRGETATLFRWLQDLPYELLKLSPSLCVGAAWAAVADGRIAEVEQWLEWAEVACRKAEQEQSGPDGEFSMTVDRVVLRAYLAIKRRDVPGTLHWLTQAGQTRQKVLMYTRCIVFQPLQTSLLGGVFGWFGHLKEKARAMESGIYLKARSLIEPSARGGYILVANAEALYEWNKPDTAIKSLVAGMEEAQRAGEAGVLLPALFTLAKINLARGDLPAALAVVTDAERQVRDLSRLQWLFPLAALKARLNLAAGDTRAVNDWLAHNRLDIYDRLSVARAYEHVTLARVLLARGQAREAHLFLERLLVFAKKERHLPQIIEVSNLLAIVCDAAGRTAEALEMLRRNLALGRDNGYLRSFVDEGKSLLVLLRRLSRSGKLTEDEASYVGQLLALARESPMLRYPGLQAVLTQCNSLTTRELAVLRLVATGLDNRAIAGEMSVGPETVKTYLARIYGKLEVSGRRDAVRRARELGILQ